MDHPTIRQITSVSMPKNIDPKSTALLVIDFQKEYFSGAMPIPNGMTALHNAKRLIAFADRIEMPVIHVQHIAPAGSPIFAENGMTIEFHDAIEPSPHHTVLKKSSVSVFSTTDIHLKLAAANVKTLIIAGLMTHACVAGAARDASPAGYGVIVIDDACATRDINTTQNDMISHEALHRASLVTIADTFGDILTTNQVLQLPLA